MELVVAAGLLALLAALFTGAILAGEQGAATAGQRVRANFLAEEGLEAARNIRDAAYANLSNGTFGIATTSGSWAFSGASDTSGIFTRSVTVSTLDAANKSVVSTVTWPVSSTRTGSVSLATTLTNADLLRGQARRFVASVSGANAGAGGNRDLLGVTLQNTGSSAITIATMTVSWTNAFLAQQVLISGSTRWSGSAASGSVLNLTDTPIAAGATVPLTRMRFSGNMTGAQVTLTFTFADGSSATVTTPVLP